jgi:lambda family phage portal protein
MSVPVILDASGQPLRGGQRTRYGARAFAGASIVHPDVARWTPANYSPAAAMAGSRDLLVSRIHDLARNDGWASAALSRQVDAVIGSGWRLSAKPIASRLGIKQEAADELADRIEDAFAEWANDPRFICDAHRRLPLGGLLGMAFRHRLADGEAFAVLHWDEDEAFSTSIEIIHPDRCATPVGKREGDGIRTGVELSRRGAPVAYHFLTQHPGDGIFGMPAPRRWQRLPRQTSFGRPIVVHAFEPIEAGQVRGIPVLSPVVKKLRMLGRYDEAELQAAVLNAVLAAFITSPFDHEQVANAIGMPEDAELSGLQNMRATLYGETPINIDGVRINFLAPGDKPEFLDAKHPNAVFEHFVRTSLRNVASAVGLSYEQLSMDWGQVNYSSARAALIEVWRGLTARRDLFAATFMGPIYAGWLEEALDRGTVKPPRGASPFDEAIGAWTQARWIGPGRGWVDPKREAEAAVLRLAAGVSNYERECAEQGLDYKDNFRQIARERRDKEALGLKFAATVEPSPDEDPDAEVPANRRNRPRELAL